ncbi:MAG TPA: peptidoglycan DD-metalloendopeptidase family protein [Terriglobales bacterium]|nr:peptidoglycan DD-metalloendopeptidase family protein [Terriglobales bacterium]
MNAPKPTAPSIVEGSVNAESRIGVKVRSGDTLGSVLKRFGVAPPSAHALIEKVRPFVNPRKIRPGDDVHVVINTGDRTVRAMEFVVDDNILIRVKATEAGWSAERHDIPFVRETQVIRGTIKGSLYESGIEAGLSPQQILDLAKIFEYDIDFFSDFQPGDDFKINVEELRYADGRRAPGRIIAAELEASKEVFGAFYFLGRDGNGDYYGQNGEAMRRSFLRAPLSYSRISSPFNPNRLHPIFRTVRPHLAIDYAAPAGTPVVAIGRGRVEFVGWRNGYGNVVDIRHSGNYMSRYAHFSRFAPNLRAGQSVDPGDVIGFVGQTGHATGPHLHFEFLRGGTKINFLSLRIAKSQQLTGDELTKFTRLRDQQQALLDKTDEHVADTKRQGL